MRNMMTKIAKGGMATAAVGAMALASATPAAAQDYYDDDDGISVGDVIAGAVILGGIAAIATSIGDDDRYDDRYYNNGYYGDRWDYRGNPRSAVERCVSAATQNARRYGYRYARVTEIRNVNDRRYGWRVKGRIEVDGNRGYGRYGYGRDNDRGNFTCEVSRGRVVGLDYNGIRGLG